jgi:single-strand DNA-binding protein
MAGVNKAILIGNLGADPEIRHLEGGKVVARLRLATSEFYTRKDTGERVEQTEWHTVVLWNRQAEVAEKYLKKGSQVYVEGKITTREWEDKDGNKRYTTEIMALSMTMLDSKGSSQSAPAQAPAPAATTANSTVQSQANADTAPLEDNTEDDLPF